MSITSIKQAKDLLSQYAPPGESLAFINPSEAKALKKMGGSGEMTEAGIPTYSPLDFVGDVFDDVGDFFEDAKDEVSDWIPKELGEYAQYAALIPGPHQGLAAGLSALGGLKEAGLKGALKRGLGSYMGGKFTGGLFNKGLGVTGTQWDPFGAGKWLSGTKAFTPIEWLGGQAQSAGEGVRGWFSPSDQLSTTGTDTSKVVADPSDPLKDVAYRSPEYIEASKAAGKGGYYSTAAGHTAKGMEIASSPSFWDASFGEKWNIAKEWFAGLDPKVKWALGLGSAAAALQYLENKANQKKQLKFEKGTLAYTPEYRTVEDINPDVSIGQGSKNGGIIRLANGGQPTMEMDYRGGGFIPVGAQERADDVPARLSKNEFVMTADAVRAAGGGSVDVGAQRMYNLMNQLEGAA